MRGLTFIAVVIAALVGLSSAADVSASSSKSNPPTRRHASRTLQNQRNEIVRRNRIKQPETLCTEGLGEECDENLFDSQGSEEANFKKRDLRNRILKKEPGLGSLLGDLLGGSKFHKGLKFPARPKPAKPAVPAARAPLGTKDVASEQGPNAGLSKRKLPI